MPTTTDLEVEDGLDPHHFAERHHLLVLPSLEALLEAHDLTGVAHEAFPNDGWSGAHLSVLTREGERLILKRDRLADDWISRATDDTALREACFAASLPVLPAPAWVPFLGAARDGDGYALLMPDLSGILFDWEKAIDEATLERVLAGMARLHRPWWPAGAEPTFPWCAVRERLSLLSRRSAARYAEEGLVVGERFLAGWDAFDRHAPAAARELVGRLEADPVPLVDALARLPATQLHGDLKLANIGFTSDGRMALVDWQMTLTAPVAVELGWFLVSNSANLPLPPEAVLERYRESARKAGSEPVGWAEQVDLVWIIGLLLRGWRKGLDAEAGGTLPSGVRAADDLAWWCERALEAAGRRLDRAMPTKVENAEPA
jgi:hypothetical protein